jgi:hypothetical protein
MTTTETHFFNLLWATDVDRRLTAAVALDRAIRASVETRRGRNPNTDPTPVDRTPCHEIR